MRLDVIINQDKVLYLDIDGVLNGHERLPSDYCGSRKDCIENMNLILDQVPDLKLILSTSWRYLIITGQMNLQGFESMMLTHGLKCRNRIIDYTRPDNDEYEPRGAIILEHAIRYEPGKWLVLDDLELDLGPNQIVTDGNKGLTKEQALEVIRFFNGT